MVCRIITHKGILRQSGKKVTIKHVEESYTNSWLCIGRLW